MPGYEILAGHPFNDFIHSVIGREVRMGNTITFLSEVDLTEVESVRAAAVRRGVCKPTFTAFVAKAVALALREFPYANRRLYPRFWRPFSRVRLQQFKGCDVTVAVERNLSGTEAATFIDVLRDVDRMTLAEISGWLRDLAVCDETNNEAWRELKWFVMRPPVWLMKLLTRLPLLFPSIWAKHRGGAVMISAPSKYGVDMMVGAWTAPLGVSFGLVKDRPVVRDGNVVPCRTFTLTLNWDRRIMAGAQAARFYKRIVEILEHAATEMKPFLPALEAEAPAQPVVIPGRLARSPVEAGTRVFANATRKLSTELQK